MWNRVEQIQRDASAREQELRDRTVANTPVDLAKLSAEVHSQYLLSFAPTGAAPGHHKIEVRVSVPKARVRARPAYWVQNP